MKQLNLCKAVYIPAQGHEETRGASSHEIYNIFTFAFLENITNYAFSSLFG